MHRKKTVKSWRINSGLLNLLFDRIRCGLNRRLVHYLTASAVLKQDSRVLEAGCGTAFASSVFKQNNRWAVALDIDVEALQEARRRDFDLKMVAADLEALPFKDEVFDLVWNNSTLEHLDDLSRALKQMKRVLRQGGYIFVGVPYAHGPLGFQRWISKTKTGIWIGRVFYKQQLQAFFSSVGLEIVEYKVYFFSFFLGVLARKI